MPVQEGYMGNLGEGGLWVSAKLGLRLQPDSGSSDPLSPLLIADRVEKMCVCWGVCSVRAVYCPFCDLLNP